MRNSSGFRRLFYIFLFLFLIVLGGVIYLTFQPQDMTDIAGKGKKTSLIDVSSRIGQAAKSRKSVVITEREVNTWLASILTARQEGRSAEFLDLSITGVWVRFSENNGGRAEIVLERLLQGRPHTVSMYFRIEHEKKDNRWTTYIHKDGGLFLGVVPLGGRFGKARVPQGFLLFVKPAFEELGKTFQQELNWLQTDITEQGGGKIRIEENQLRIDFPAAEQPPATFPAL